MSYGYYYALYSLIFCGYLFCTTYKEFTKAIIILLFVLLVLFQTIKNPLVDDGITYFRIFNSVSDFFDFVSFGKEPAFSVIPALLKKLDIFNRYTVFAVFAVIGVGFKLRYFAEYSYLPILSILIYFSFYYIELDCSGIRSGCACGIFLWAIQDIQAGNFKVFCTKIVLATFFHMSILVALPLYFMNTKKANVNIYLFIFLIFVVLDGVNLNPINFVLPNLGSIDRISNYVTGTEANGDVFSPFTKLYFIYMFEVYYLLARSEALLRFNSCAVIMVKLLYFGILILYVLGPVSYTMASRLSEIFTLLNCIILTYFVYINENIFQKIIIRGLLIFYSGFSLYTVLSSGTLVARHYF